MNARVDLASHADAQSNRILNAAQCCFAERGFHAASMASIAETAGISAGLIYRYFKSKHEIIQGIVQRQLDLLGEDMAASPANVAELVDVLVQSYYESKTCGRGRGLEPALVMEIAAESRRDPTIARAIEDFDRQIDGHIRGWLQRPREEGGIGLDDAQAARRALLLRLIMHGMKMHQLRQPDLDPALLHATLAESLARLLAA